MRHELGAVLTREPQQVRCGENRLHLAVFGVESCTERIARDVRLELAKLCLVETLRVNAVLALRRRESFE